MKDQELTLKYSDFVSTEAMRILNDLARTCVDFCGDDQKSTWLLRSRIINSIFQVHYGVTLATVEEKVMQNK